MGHANPHTCIYQHTSLLSVLSTRNEALRFGGQLDVDSAWLRDCCSICSGRAGHAPRLPALPATSTNHHRGSVEGSSRQFVKHLITVVHEFQVRGHFIDGIGRHKFVCHTA